MLKAIPAQQNRSRRTHDRIIEAAGEVFASAGIADASMAEIASRADVAVGTLYGRFPNKEALVHAFIDGFFAKGQTRFLARFAADKWEASSLDDLVRGFIEYRARYFREKRALLKAILNYVRTSTDDHFRRPAGEYSARVREQLHTLLAERLPHLPEESVGRVIVTTLTIVEATLKEIIVFGEKRSAAVAMRDEEVTRELTAVVLLYLRNAGA